MFKSVSHTFKTTDPEVVSQTDDTPYSAIVLANPKSNAAGSFRWGGPEITNISGGIEIDKGDEFYIVIPNQPARLNQVFVCGAVGDVVDVNCYPPTAG